MRRGCQVCVILTQIVFIPLYSNFIRYDCSHIEDVHLLLCIHLINIFTFIMGVELRHFFHPKCVGCVWFVYSETPTVFIPLYSNFA